MNAAMNDHATSTPNSNAIVHEFEGRKIPVAFWRGQHWWPARHVGRAIDQSDEGRQFVRNIVESTDAIEGIDYRRLAGVELAEFQGILDVGHSPTSRNPRRGPREMIVLSRTGLDMALLKSRTEIGKRMRAWIVREVLPSLRDNGVYAVPSAVVQNDNATATVNEAALVDKIAERVKEMFDRQEQKMADATQVAHSALPGLGRYQGYAIASRVKQLAERVQAMDATRTVRSNTTLIHNTLRTIAEFGVSGCRWDLAPPDKFLRAIAVLDSLLSVIPQARPSESDGPLFQHAK